LFEFKKIETDNCEILLIRSIWLINFIFFDQADPINGHSQSHVQIQTNNLTKNWTCEHMLHFYGRLIFPTIEFKTHTCCHAPVLGYKGKCELEY
jgi:hypothetical protein